MIYTAFFKKKLKIIYNDLKIRQLLRWKILAVYKKGRRTNSEKLESSEIPQAESLILRRKCHECTNFTRAFVAKKTSLSYTPKKPPLALKSFMH